MCKNVKYYNGPEIGIIKIDFDKIVRCKKREQITNMPEGVLTEMSHWTISLEGHSKTIKIYEYQCPELYSDMERWAEKVTET